jgi:hypothetical protein
MFSFTVVSTIDVPQLRDHALFCVSLDFIR